MAHSRTMPIRSLLVNGTHRFASCWKIERTDGIVLRFTDHNQNLTVDGEVYEPLAGSFASSRQRSEGTSPQNMDIRGSLTSATITEEDLRLGKYREAKVTDFTVDWQYPFAGKFRLSVYYIENTTFDGEVWYASIAGLKVRLTQVIGDLYERKCRFQLYDSNCTVNPAAYTFSGTVATVVSANRIITSGLTNITGFFDDGLLTWTSGANNGLAFDVKRSVVTSGRVELQIRTPQVIVPGDTFSIRAGCNKLSGINPNGATNLTGHCKNKFNNLANFGGYPTIPGNDELYNTPNAKR